MAIKPRKMSGACSIVRNTCTIFARKLRKDLGDLYINGKIKLMWILKKQGVRVCTGFICLRTGSNGEYGSEPLDSIKGREILD
jgi:hypothetical protein